MGNSSSFARRLALLTIVSALMLVLAVGGASAAPGEFDLLTPANETTIDDPSTITTMTWQAAADAVSYTLTVTRPGGAEDVVVTGTPDEDPDDITCDAETCTAAVAGATDFAAEGAYSWSVVAVDAAEAETTSTSTFTFTVDIPEAPTAPDPFTLSAPANNAYLRIASAAQEVSWTRADGATDYEVYGFQISNNVKIGDAFFEEVTAETAGCAAQEPTCTIPVDLSAATSGKYAWTVVAFNAEGSTEASNGPWFFTLNTGAVELITNGGFELQGANKATPANWNRPLGGPSGKRVCNAAALPTNVSGLCAMKGTGIPGAMVQKVPNAFVQSLGLLSGDTLSVSGLLQAKNAPAAGSRIVIQVKGTGGTGGNIVVPLTAATYGDNFEPLSGTLSNLPLPAGVADVTRIKVKIVSASKFFLDDLSISVDPIGVVPPLGSIPVPAAP